MSGRYATHGPTLVDHGWDITPVQGKRPILEGWSNRPEAAVRFHDYNGASIGVLCGGKYNVVAIDVDVMNPFAANELQQLIEDELGFGPRRIGKAPKFLMLFRCSEPVRKIKTGTYWIDDADAAVEVLAEGQQFVASGIHPDTQAKYVWPDDNILDLGPLDLQEVTPEQLEQFREKAARVLDTYGDLKGRVSTRSALPRGGLNLSDLSGERATVTAALDVLPNADEHYDDWIATLHAIKGALGEEGRELAHDWSKRSAKYEAQETDRAWDSIKNVNHIGAGSLYHWAREYGFDLRGERQAQDAPATVAAEEQRQRGAFNIVSLDELNDLPPPVPLIDGLLFQDTLINLFGPPASFKSFIALDMGLSIAHGRKWQGRSTESGPVLYIAGEGSSGIRKRAKAWRRHNNITNEKQPFFVLPQGVDMRSVESIDAIVEAALDRLGEPPALVVIDTLNRNFGGGDENNNQDMGDFIAGADRMRAAFDGCAILVVHHSGKDQSKGARGHSSLYGAVDTEIEVKRIQGTSVVTMTNTKQKEAEEEQVIQLQAVAVMLPPSGPLSLEEESSLVLEVTTQKLPEQKRRPRGKHAKVIYDTLRDLMPNAEERYVGNNTFVRCVTEDDLRRHAFPKMSCDVRHKSSRFSDAIAGLQADEMVSYYDGNIWI